jgi:hypothetical protein
MPESADFVAEFKNVYELEHRYACGTYSDVYKDVMFGRPRHSYGEWTLAELETETERLCESVSY